MGSEQKVLDCNGRYGCDGGHVQTVLEWAYDQGGMCSQDAYSYRGVESYCSECDAPRHFRIVSIYYGTNAEDLRIMLLYSGSTSIYMFVEAAFQSYMSGVYACEESASINHAGLQWASVATIFYFGTAGAQVGAKMDIFGSEPMHARCSRRPTELEALRWRHSSIKL